MATTTSSSLHNFVVDTNKLFLRRFHIFAHITIGVFLFYYRVSRLYNAVVYNQVDFPIISWTIMLFSEVMFNLIWILVQGFGVRRLIRSVFPERLPVHVVLPGIDVFICTADVKKEPVIDVMNTVISAMALDYPPEQLNVYCSDDGGSIITLNAVGEAQGFARLWVPFCRKYKIRTLCPDAYFTGFGDKENQDQPISTDEFAAEYDNMKLKYEEFKRRVQKLHDNVNPEDKKSSLHSGGDAFVKVFEDNRGNENNEKLPLLVYVSRERKPLYPHHSKAGNLNALLRVSGIISNSPYILVLDCDMYCNDPLSARQAMCFLLDPNLSRTLAFVQYPQIFYTVTNDDIYAAQAKYAFKAMWRGMDGLRGPLLSGTGFFLKRKALYATPNQDDSYLDQAKKRYGFSDVFIESLNESKSEQYNYRKTQSSEDTIKEAQFLATCSFENGTEWGSEIGFLYDCLLESTFTGYVLHCRGWTSAYYYPERPAFMGCATLDMKDAVVQLRKWNAELLQFGLSKYSPLTYGMSRMSIFQSMCYAYFTFNTLLSIPYLIYGTVPQICFYKGIPVFPEATSPWFAVFAMAFASALMQHLFEILGYGSTVKQWLIEEMMRIVKSLTASLFGLIDTIIKRIGFKLSAGGPTNKAYDNAKLEKYKKGKYDFQGAEVFMVPLVVLATMNIVCLIAGVRKMVTEGSFDEMFAQFLLSSLILVFCFSLVKSSI